MLSNLLSVFHRDVYLSRIWFSVLQMYLLYLNSVVGKFFREYKLDRALNYGPANQNKEKFPSKKEKRNQNLNFETSRTNFYTLYVLSLLALC